MPTLVVLLLAAFLVSIPSLRTVAGVTYTTHPSILISSNSQFTTSNGVTQGTGTVSDPYVIQGWNISAPSSNAITVVNTTVSFIIRNVQVNSAIRGIFLLNVVRGTVQSAIVSRNQYGVLLDHSSQIKVSDNNISRDQDGVFLDYSTRVTVSGNNISQATGWGIITEYSTNSVISGNRVSSSANDISIAYSSNETVSGNTLTNPSPYPYGRITLDHADHITVSKNTVSGGTLPGLSFLTSSYAGVSGNNFSRVGISFDRQALAQLDSDSITSDNTLGGKPIYFYKDCAGVNLDGVPVGQALIVNCTGIRVANISINGTSTAITVVRSRGLLISSTQLQNNALAVNAIQSSYVSIVRSTIANNEKGLNLENVSSVEILENKISNNSQFLVAPVNLGAVLLDHNNFLGGNNQLSDGPGGGPGLFDMVGYPSGGNYWSDYAGLDNCSGPSQNICPNPDGIGDTPANEGDPYPLMKPYSPPSDTISPVWPSGGSFTSSNVTLTGVTLNWTPATDDLEIAVYRIQQRSTVIAYLPRFVRTYAVTGLTPATGYTFTIAAGDSAGNWGSNQTLTVSTLSPPIMSITPSQAWYLAIYAVTIVSVGSVLAYRQWRKRRAAGRLVSPVLVPTP